MALLTCTFVLGKPNPSRGGACQVYIRCRRQGVAIADLPTGQHTERKQWDTARQRIKGRGRETEETNQLLAVLMGRVEAEAKRALLAGTTPTRQTLAYALESGESLFGPGIHDLALDELIALWIERRGGFVNAGVRENYQALRKTLIDYAGLAGLPVRNLSRAVLDGYRQYCLTTLGNVNSTINAKMGRVKAVLRWAFGEGILSLDKTSAIPPPLPNKRQMNEMYLTFTEDLPRIVAVNLAGLPKGAKTARDLLIIQMHTGLRYRDLMALDLRNRNITAETEYITGLQTKTGQHVTILITPALVEAMDRHGWVAPKMHITLLNILLKQIGERAGLEETVPVVRWRGAKKEIEEVPKWQLMSTHVHRSSFITHLLNSGLPPNLAQKLSGHASIMQLMRYDRSTAKDAATAALKIFNAKPPQG